MEFGETSKIRADIFKDGIYEQLNYYYICDAESMTVEQTLTESEKESGYHLVHVSLNEAIKQNEVTTVLDWMYIESETYAMKLLVSGMLK